MAPAPNQSQTDETQSIAQARIDAQDALYIEPLREFLQEAGCSVVVNRPTAAPPLYWICVGDSDFVKAFLEGNIEGATKRLAIVYEGDISEQKAHHTKVKIVLVDPIPLTAAVAREIFAFFFTSRVNIRNTRKGLGTRRVVSVMPKQQSREAAAVVIPQTNDEDATRVHSIMKQIFAQPKTSVSSALPIGLGGWGKRVVLSIVGVIGIPLVLYVASILLAVGCISIGSLALTRGNSKLAATAIRQSSHYTQGATSMVQMASPILRLMGGQGFLEDQELFLAALSDVAKSEQGVINVLDTGKQIAVSLLSTEESTTPVKGLADVVALRADVSAVAQHLALVQAQVDSLLSSHRFPFGVVSIQQLAHRGVEKLITLRHMVEYAQRLLVMYPEMGGFRKKQTYLVLLQNSMELRPTGGFIGSILLVSFTDGKLSSLEVQDVYTADGQLKGHVDPPLPIRTILGQEHWYLRDSNWDPDFSLSGAQAAWFYEKEMNTKVDGVIAISLPLVTKLLEVTGPLELPDFNERISANNFFVKSLLYTQTDFFPGSTQKKDFLGSLTNALLLRLTTDKNISAGTLFSAIAKSLDARDAQFYFTDANLSGILSQWGWSGKTGVSSCLPAIQHTGCVSDGVGVVQANLGVNKANYFIKQEAVSRISIEENGDMHHDMTMILNNTSTNQGHDGGGDYQSYIRVLYPENTTIVGVTVDGQPIPLRDPASKEATISAVMVEHTPTGISVGFPVSVAAHGQKQISISTARLGVFPANLASSYEFTIRKQAGVEHFPWHVSVEYPERWRVESDLMLAKPGVVEYNTDLEKDGQMNLFFTPSL